jgi:peptidoglycan hydrolase CwlO-like protein
MDLKNMKISIGLVIAIIVQAFGIIWYVAQLDSTVESLNSTVTQLQEEATTIDIAVLNTDVDNIKDKIEMMDAMHSERFDSTDLESAVKEIEDELNDVIKRQAIIENEMRSIMSDHSGFNDILKQMGKEGYGDKREYGNYD